MNIQTKIERIKTEITFLIEGAGTVAEKQAALAEVAGPYIDNLMAVEVQKEADAAAAE